MNLFVMDLFSLNHRTLCRPFSVHMSDLCTCMVHVKSGEGYQKRVASFWPNRANTGMKIRTLDLSCTDHA